jgi:hypothetical protein
MQQREWHALGQALKALRMARDLGQKEVVTRSGEEMSVRTLRGYESGEQRPSRDRLLRLVISSFDLRSVDEINRYLQLAGYAYLTAGEIQQHGPDPSVTKADSNRSTTRPGAPVDFRIEVSTLIVTDGQGREVWRYQFSSRLTQTAYEHQDAIRRCDFADLDGDGGVETLFVYVPLNFGSVGAILICFAEDGKIKWQFEPGRTVRDTTGREYSPPYFISNVQIIPVRDTGPRILVSSNHYLHNPNQIAMLDPSGNLISEYWHSGHLLSVVHADFNGDGIEEILLAGVNNGYRQATMVAFDPRHVNGASTQPGRQILGFHPGTEKAVVLFPKTCLAKNAPYNRVASLWVTRERRIALAVAEGVSEARNPGVMIYELDFGLKVINARPDSHLQESHRALEAQGLLDHSWTEEETEYLRRQVIIKGRL